MLTDLIESGALDFALLTVFAFFGSFIAVSLVCWH
jgi:hypothetical protein